MQEIRIAIAQFANRDNDKPFNLSRINQLAGKPAEGGAEIVSFHEERIPGYWRIQPLDKDQLLEVAEAVPDGRSVQKLIEIARRHQHGVAIQADCNEKRK